MLRRGIRGTLPFYLLTIDPSANDDLQRYLIFRGAHRSVRLQRPQCIVSLYAFEQVRIYSLMVDYPKCIKSHCDLPLKLNKRNSVVRWEFKDPRT